MNTTEFLSLVKSRGATIYPAAAKRDTELANNALQSRRCAMLPSVFLDLYNFASAINIGNGYIFGPINVDRGINAPIPSIVDININLISTPEIRGKTIFGRNDLFWFAFDAFGNCEMLDNITLSTLRKYDDPYRAITDCLIIGKI